MEIPNLLLNLHYLNLIIAGRGLGYLRFESAQWVLYSVFALFGLVSYFYLMTAFYVLLNACRGKRTGLIIRKDRV